MALTSLPPANPGDKPKKLLDHVDSAAEQDEIVAA
jgi:hypothetical protein